MATGAADANGIWIYGEDDTESTHSALLNKLASSTSTKIGQANTNITALQAKTTFKGAIVQAKTGQSTGSAGAWVNTLWATELIDTDDIFTVGTSETRLTVKTTGYYNIFCKLRFGSTVYDTGVILYKNGTEITQTYSLAKASAYGSMPQFSYLDYGNVNDYYEIKMLGSSPSLLLNEASSIFTIERIG